MAMKPLNINSAIAIDGGGIKGLVVARALRALEAELGGGPLINHPQIKILAGTSTGAVITSMIALGLTADQIATKYRSLGQEVFPPVAPTWFPEFLQTADRDIQEVLKTSLYPNDKMIAIARELIGEATGNPDLTLGQLDQLLSPRKQSLILTTVNIIERRTHFLKSSNPVYADWKLWEAIIASAASPIALPVVVHTEADGTAGYYTDGGVGSFGNPAYIAAREAVAFQGYAPDTVSVLSFGTGWVNNEGFAKSVGKPDTWHALNWAMNGPLILVWDMARNQSVDILEAYTQLDGSGLDFRRFQFLLDKDIDADAFASNAVYDQLVVLGDELGDHLHKDEYAPSLNPKFDPEGLYNQWQIRLKAMGK